MAVNLNFQSLNFFFYYLNCKSIKLESIQPWRARQMQITYDAEGNQVMIDKSFKPTFSIEFQPYTLKEILYNTLKSLVS